MRLYTQDPIMATNNYIIVSNGAYVCFLYYELLSLYATSSLVLLPMHQVAAQVHVGSASRACLLFCSTEYLQLIRARRGKRPSRQTLVAVPQGTSRMKFASRLWIKSRGYTSLQFLSLCIQRFDGVVGAD